METKIVKIQKQINEFTESIEDIVAIEEPLETQLIFYQNNERIKKQISVTMRTPGADEYLCTGFLFTEGIINHFEAIDSVKKNVLDPNIIEISLKQNVIPNIGKIDRNFYTTSSCGVCGKSSIEAIKTNSIFSIQANKKIDTNILYNLQNKLKKQQQVFEKTGGIHASAFFDFNGQILLMQEDVGRHNALDKLIGEALQKNMLPLSNGILLLSGRASFELIQKAYMAGIGNIVAVGAPSSLAIDTAKETGIQLMGFLRENSVNIYC